MNEEMQELYADLYDQVWDEHYNWMHDGFNTAFDANWWNALEELMIESDIADAYVELMRSTGKPHIVVFLRDNFKHLCAKCYAHQHATEAAQQIWETRHKQEHE